MDELAEVGVPLLKIASGEIVDLPLIRKAAGTGIPLIISTGMATLEEVGEAVTAAEEAGASALALMQCASVYPADPALINLRAMDTLRERFGVPAGLSDHTLGIAIPAAAAALGAAMIEKHITLDRSMEGPDHSFAIEPDELAAMVTGVRDAEAALGDGRKEGPSEAERDENYVLARRSLIAARDLPAGTVIDAGMLTVKRPGSGIAPKHFDDVVGSDAGRRRRGRRRAHLGHVRVSGYEYPPLRREDIQALRRFRNEQIDVLRQAEVISEEQQERWFEERVVPAQRDPKPDQVLRVDPRPGRRLHRLRRAHECALGPPPGGGLVPRGPQAGGGR